MQFRARRGKGAAGIMRARAEKLHSKQADNQSTGGTPMSHSKACSGGRQLLFVEACLCSDIYQTRASPCGGSTHNSSPFMEAGLTLCLGQRWPEGSPQREERRRSVREHGHACVGHSLCHSGHICNSISRTIYSLLPRAKGCEKSGKMLFGCRQ